jgi:hypothetical protein
MAFSFNDEAAELAALAMLSAPSLTVEFTPSTASLASALTTGAGARPAWRPRVASNPT